MPPTQSANLVENPRQSRGTADGGHLRAADLETRGDIRAGELKLRDRMLIVTPVVPPVPTAGAFVVKGLLSRFDPDEVVLAARRWDQNPPDQTHASSGHPIHFLGGEWQGPKRGKRFVAWLKWLLLPGMSRRLVRLARAMQCGAVLGIFPDELSLCAGLRVARRLGVPFFPYFHNTYCENRRGLSRLLATWIQNRVFRHAQVVFVMSDGMREEWQSLYRHVRFESLVHTFDEPIAAPPPLPAIVGPTVRLGYLGLISEANLDALKRICQVVNSADHLSLNIYSGASDWQLEHNGLTGERIRHTQPSDAELLEALRSNDILILPHGLTGGLAEIEYRTIFPTRTIPYLLSGRPILAHSARGSFLSRWLRDNDCAELVEDPDPQALLSAIDRLSHDQPRREQLVQNALAAAEQFRADRVVGNMKEIVNRVSASNRPRLLKQAGGFDA
jgi:glycosyltransferase involved in cell wall biosynthesis